MKFPTRQEEEALMQYESLAHNVPRCDTLSYDTPSEDGGKFIGGPDLNRHWPLAPLPTPDWH